MTKRNGKIELLRFVFCILVLLYHIGKDYFDGGLHFGNYLTFFAHGRSGVEFFFILSGFFAAKNAYKLRDDKTPIGKASMNFMYKKTRTVFIPHLIVIFLTSIFILVSAESPLVKIWSKLPSILFLQQTGITKTSANFISVEWYIASMLLALAIIYPLLRKNYDVTARIVAPVGSVMLMGFLIRNYGKFPNSKEYHGWFYDSNFRAIAIILLGVFAFEVSRIIVEKGIFERNKIMLIIVENVCFIFAIYFTFSNLKKYESYLVAALFIAITICLSREVKCKFYNNKFVYLLGKLSLPIYLSQNVVRKVVQLYFADLRIRWQAVIIVVLTIVVGILVQIITDQVEKLIAKRKALVK